jgi:hypothetical protein
MFIANMKSRTKNLLKRGNVQRIDDETADRLLAEGIARFSAALKRLS